MRIGTLNDFIFESESDFTDEEMRKVVNWWKEASPNSRRALAKKSPRYLDVIERDIVPEDDFLKLRQGGQMGYRDIKLILQKLK